MVAFLSNKFTLTTFLSLLIAIIALFVPASSYASPNSFVDQSLQGSLTPLQFEIEKQTRLLGSIETEERREAVTRLGSMHHPAASRAALPALRDPVAIIRATAAAAILSLPSDESAANLVPLLADNDEFVRREVAFALGKTRDQSAVLPLIERLNSDKKDSVRGAVAVALGELKDAAATLSIAQILSPGFGTTTSRSSRKSKKADRKSVV